MNAKVAIHAVGWAAFFKSYLSLFPADAASSSVVLVGELLLTLGGL